MSRLLGARGALAVVAVAVAAIGCSSESVSRPSISPQVTAAGGLDSAWMAAVPGSERQGMIGLILSSLQAGAPMYTLHFTVNGKAVAYPSVGTYTVQTLGGSFYDSAYSVTAWSDDAADTIWLLEFDIFGPKLYMTTVDSVNYAAPSTTVGSTSPSALAGACVPLATQLPQFGTPSNGSCQYQTVMTTLSAQLNAPGATLDIDVPAQSVAGIHVVAALLGMDRILPSPGVTTSHAHARTRDR